MRESSFIFELRKELRRQGVWGMRAERLLQDWSEHVREDIEHRQEQGAALEAAEEAAWAALGRPDVLAVRAGRELAQASWLGRHPWLGGLWLPVLGWFVALAVVVLLPVWVTSLIWNLETLEKTHFPELLVGLKYWQLIVNWGPWLLGLAWLARIATRMPGGWKHFWITAAALITFSTSIWMTVQPPLHGPNTGTLMICFGGIPGTILNLFSHLLGWNAFAVPWYQWMSLTGPCWIKVALMTLGVIAFRLKVSSPLKATA